MERSKPDTLLKLALAVLVVLPAPVLFLIFRERPFEDSEGFAYLRIGLAIISFMIYMMARYITGFLKMAKMPRFFPAALASAVVVFVIVIGVFASSYGKWWAEYLPHGAIGVYAVWRMKL